MSEDLSSLAALLGPQQLKAGAVIFKCCQFEQGPRDKFLVVASTEPRLLVLTINTAINPFFIKRGLDKYHVPVLLAEHDFLYHDSYTNCIEAITAFDLTSIREEIVNDYRKVFKGFLSDSCLKQVHHAIGSNNMIVRGHQREILASIGAQLEHRKTVASN